MQFKDEKLEEEFNGPLMDPRVVDVVRRCDAWLLARFGKSFFVTGCVRPVLEQARIYPDNPTKPSPHVITEKNPLCRAVDGRRTHLTGDEVLQFVAWFSNEFSRWFKALLLVDDRGPQHPHFHIAVYKS